MEIQISVSKCQVLKQKVGQNDLGAVFYLSSNVIPNAQIVRDLSLSVHIWSHLV